MIRCGRATAPCLEISLASVTDSSRMGAALPLDFGGLGLSSAARLRHAAHWASWAVQMVHPRHSTVTRTIIEAMEFNDPSQTAQGVVSSVESLRAVGSAIPSWKELLRDGANTNGSVEEEDHSQPRLDAPCTGILERGIASSFWTSRRRRSSALRLVPSLQFPSPACPHSGRPRSPLSPSGCSFSVVCAFFLPPLCTLVPVWPFTRLDCRGHHRSACSRAGILGHRGHPMESVMARICREAGARVRTNIMVRDLDLGVFNQLDGWRLVSPCGEVPNLPSTPRWCLPSERAGL